MLDSQDLQAFKVLQAPQVRLDRPVNQAALVSKVPGVSQVLMDSLVAVVIQGPRDRQVSQERRVTEGRRDSPERLVHVAKLVRLASRVSPAGMVGSVNLEQLEPWGRQDSQAEMASKD